MISQVLKVLSDSDMILAVFAALIGLCVGSFLNVVIYRVPKRMHQDWKAQSIGYLEGVGYLDEHGRSVDADHGDAGQVNADRVNAGDHSNTNQSGATPLEAVAPLEDQRPLGLAWPPSHCTQCETRLRAIDNIPVLSYLLLRGRCSSCQTRISLRYPAIEILCAVLTVLVALHFGVQWKTLGAMAFTWTLIALTFIDIDEKLLPDDITLPGIWAGLLLNLFGVMTDIKSAVIGAIAGYLILWLVYQLFKITTGKEGMGFGDFKLLAMIGAWLGWQVLPLVIVLSSVGGAIFGIAMIVSGQQQRGQHIPFGPYLAFGGWVALLWGSTILERYSAIY